MSIWSTVTWLRNHLESLTKPCTVTGNVVGYNKKGDRSDKNNFFG